MGFETDAPNKSSELGSAVHPIHPSPHRFPLIELVLPLERMTFSEQVLSLPAFEAAVIEQMSTQFWAQIWTELCSVLTVNLTQSKITQKDILMKNYLEYVGLWACL